MGSVVTPKRRRMVNVLDVLETSDSISLAPTGKVVEADKTQPKAATKQIEVETTVTQVETEAGPQCLLRRSLPQSSRGPKE
jgi:hypothetical protein